MTFLWLTANVHAENVLCLPAKISSLQQTASFTMSRNSIFPRITKITTALRRAVPTRSTADNHSAALPIGYLPRLAAGASLRPAAGMPEVVIFRIAICTEKKLHLLALCRQADNRRHMKMVGFLFFIMYCLLIKKEILLHGYQNWKYSVRILYRKRIPNILKIWYLKLILFRYVFAYILMISMITHFIVLILYEKIGMMSQRNFGQLSKNIEEKLNLMMKYFCFQTHIIPTYFQFCIQPISNIQPVQFW